MTSQPIEFADGKHSVREFLDAIPSGYAGTLDLSICQSAVLAEPIKRRSHSCIVISNREAATPLIKLKRYRLVVDRLTRKAEPYMDAITYVHCRT